MKKVYQFFNDIEASVTRTVLRLYRSKSYKDAVIFARDILAFAASCLLLSAVIFLGGSSAKITKAECILVFLPFLCFCAYNHSFVKAKIKDQVSREKKPKGMYDIIVASAVVISVLSFMIAGFVVYH